MGVDPKRRNTVVADFLVDIVVLAKADAMCPATG
jgi:hypothetical protein